VLARTHQNLIWTRQRQINTLRSTLREFYPAALAAFEDLAHRDALAVLAKRRTRRRARRYGSPRSKRCCGPPGGQRNLHYSAEQISGALRSDQLAAPPLVAQAFGATVSALVAITAELVSQTAVVEDKLAASLERHPSADILRSLPGLGVVLGARVLAEFGDDRTRYADAQSPQELRRHRADHPRVG
jgi:transposase